MLASLAMKKFLKKTKLFKSLMLYLRTNSKQNYFQGHSFNPSLCKAYISKQTGVVPLHDGVLLALISRGQLYGLTFYLWPWNKILTHLNFSFKGPLIFCQWVTSRYIFFLCLAKHCTGCLKKWILIPICPFIMCLVDLSYSCSWPSFYSSQTEEPLRKLSLSYVFCF